MSVTRPPVDAAVRGEIRDAHDETLFVEAGAGTGKTTALVERVVAMVASGRLGLRNLAAITFTEAAAAELRDRIRLALEQVVSGDVGMAEARERCSVALEELDDAALTPLHGFAQRILTEHPLEAGLPPQFEVVDEIAASVTFDQRWAEFVDVLVDDPGVRPVLLSAFALGLTLDGIRDVARALHEHPDRVFRAHVDVVPFPPVDLAPVLEPLDEAMARAGSCQDPDDQLLAHLESLRAYQAALHDAGDDLDRLDVLASYVKIPTKYGKKPSWGCDPAEVRDLLSAAAAARNGLLDRCRLAALSVLLERVRGFVLDFAAHRRREGRLEFHDLLVLARDLLAKQPAVRAALAQRFRVLMLDEFQDTDPLQIEIAVLLGTDDPDAGARPWWEVEVAPGRLFLVGDPKQSIYRFRRADLALYHRAAAELDAAPRHLVESFRSVPQVIAWVNHVFERLLADGEQGVQAAHVELHPHREEVKGTASAVAVFGGPVDGESIAVIREREAAEVAAAVRRVKAERWQVSDPSTGETRDARYHDIALLLPTRTALPGLEDALERADVPVRIESQSLVFSTAEVRDLLSILTAVDDPTDEVAIVTALRTPACGCSDPELFEFRLAGGRWDYRAPTPTVLPADHRVVAGLGVLSGLHERRWWRSVSETVEAVVRERRFLELALVHRRPRDHWRRIRFLVDQARAWDEVGGAGLRGFVEWIEHQADERARAVEVGVPEPDDDALRILTVHGAKGLEFPIVVLAGLNTVPQRSHPPVLWTDPDHFEVRTGVASRGTRVETPGFAAQAIVEDRLDDAEQLRLLYVATTRARDHLLVSLHHKAGARCHAARIVEQLDGAPSTTLDVGGRGSAPPPEAAPGETTEAADSMATRDAWETERAAVLTRAGRPATVAATTLAKEAASMGAGDDPGLEKGGELDDVTPPWQRGRAGTAIGRAVHAVLQSIDLQSGDGLEATARAQALAEGVVDREQEVAALARSVLGAPIVREATGSGRFWREVPVAATVEGVVIEGFIDLLVESTDGLVVVDYKTDRAPTSEDLDAAMDRYRVQGAAYALALEEALRRPVVRCVFVFARPRGTAVEREVDDLGAAIREVRGLLASR